MTEQNDNKDDSKNDRLRRRQQTTYTSTFTDLPEVHNDCRQKQMYSTKQSTHFWHNWDPIILERTLH